jgi:hypothetical protein
LEQLKKHEERAADKAKRHEARAKAKEVERVLQVDRDRMIAQRLQKEESARAEALGDKAEATTETLESTEQVEEQVVLNQLLDRFAQHKVKVCNYNDKTQYVDVAGETGHKVRVSIAVMQQALLALQEKEKDEYKVKGDKSLEGQAAFKKSQKELKRAAVVVAGTKKIGVCSKCCHSGQSISEPRE